MTAKLLAIPSATAANVYCIVKRLSDGKYLDNADGSFGVAPASPYLVLTEDGTAKGMYAVSESRLPWSDSLHRVAFYKRVGGAPAPVTDAPPLAVIDIGILGDTLYDPYAQVSGATLTKSLALATRRNEKAILDGLAALNQAVGILTSYMNSMDKDQRRN